MPWDGASIKDQVNHALEGHFIIPQYISSDVANLLKRMLSVLPKSRATLLEVRSHPWLNMGYDTLPVSYFPTNSIGGGNVMADEDLLELVERMGYDKGEVVNDLRFRNTHKMSYIIYGLFLINQQHKRKAEDIQPDVNAADASIPSLMEDINNNNNNFTSPAMSTATATTAATISPKRRLLFQKNSFTLRSKSRSRSMTFSASSSKSNSPREDIPTPPQPENNFFMPKSASTYNLASISTTAEMGDHPTNSVRSTKEKLKFYLRKGIHSLLV